MGEKQERKAGNRRWYNEHYQFLLKFTAKMLKHGVDLLKEIPLARNSNRTETIRETRDQSQRGSGRKTGR